MSWILSLGLLLAGVTAEAAIGVPPPNVTPFTRGLIGTNADSASFRSALGFLSTNNTSITNYVGNAASATNLNASELRSGTVPLARLTGITGTEIADGSISNAEIANATINSNKLDAATLALLGVGGGGGGGTNYTNNATGFPGVVSGSSIGTNSGLLRLAREKIYDIRDFGANGTNDNAAIQAAIDAASTNTTGGVVYMPAGTWTLTPIVVNTNKSENQYNLLTILSNNITLRGNGRDQTTLILASTNYGGLIWNGIGGGDTTNAGLGNPTYHGPTNTVLEDFTLDGNFIQGVATNANYVHDITQLYRCDYTYVHRMRFQNIQEDALDIENAVFCEDVEFVNIANTAIQTGSTWSYFDNCRLTNCGALTRGNSGQIENTSGGWIKLSNISVYGGAGPISCRQGSMRFENSYFYFTNTTTGNFTNELSNGLYLLNCTVERPSASGPAIRMVGGTLDVIGCRFVNTAVMFLTNMNSLNFSGCRVENGPNPFFSLDGMITTSGVGGASISENDFIGQSGTGFRIVANNRTDNVRVINNYFSQATFDWESPTYPTSNSTNCLVMGNIFSAANLRCYGTSGGSHMYINNRFKSGCSFVIENKYNLIMGNLFDTVSLNSSGGTDNQWINNGFTSNIGGTGAAYTNQNYFSGNWYIGTGNPFGIAPATYTGNTTLTVYDTSAVFNGSSITCTLPSAVTVGRGKLYLVKNIHSTALTIATTSSQTIDGTTPTTIAQWAFKRYRSDGANWLTE